MYIFTHLPVWRRGGSTQGITENRIYIGSSASLFLFVLCALHLQHRFASVPQTLPSSAARPLSFLTEADLEPSDAHN